MLFSFAKTIHFLQYIFLVYLSKIRYYSYMGLCVGLLFYFLAIYAHFYTSNNTNL